MADETTHDAFIGGRLWLEQPVIGPRAGAEAVLLAAACPARTGDSVLDAGAGCGIVGLAVLARVPGIRLTAVERDPELAAMTGRNAAPFKGCVEVVCGDVCAALPATQFDHIVCNPPFFSTGTRSPQARKAAAYAWSEGDAERWIAAFAGATRQGGTLTLIFRAHAMPEMLSALAGRFGAVTLLPLWPRVGAEAKLIMLQGIRGSRAPFRLSSGLVLHERGGHATAAAEAVLRNGDALPISAGRISEN